MADLSLSAWSLCFFFPLFHVRFLRVLWFPPSLKDVPVRLSVLLPLPLTKALFPDLVLAPGRCPVAAPGPLKAVSGGTAVHAPCDGPGTISICPHCEPQLKPRVALN